jgi:predicted lactoylglutathione lyase
MKQSVSLITLGVSDYERAKSFYAALGWSPALETDEQEVDDVGDRARTARGTITRAPRETFYGGYAGVFRDVDDHAWEIAHSSGFGLAAAGSVLLRERG